MLDSLGGFSCEVEFNDDGNQLNWSNFLEDAFNHAEIKVPEVIPKEETQKPNLKLTDLTYVNIVITPPRAVVRKIRNVQSIDESPEKLIERLNAEIAALLVEQQQVVENIEDPAKARLTNNKYYAQISRKRKAVKSIEKDLYIKKIEDTLESLGAENARLLKKNQDLIAENDQLRNERATTDSYALLNEKSETRTFLVQYTTSPVSSPRKSQPVMSFENHASNFKIGL